MSAYPLNKYLINARIDAFHRQGMLSIYDFFMYVQQITSMPRQRLMRVHTKLLCRLLHQIDSHASFDYNRLKSEGILRFEADNKHMRIVFPKRIEMRDVSSAYNQGMDDSTALGEAMRQSRISARNSRKTDLRTDQGCKTGSQPKAARHSQPEIASSDIMNVKHPTALCCPISLELLEDPVQTLRGSTFSRKCIEAWFRYGNRIDPIDGSVLKLVVLVPHVEMRLCVERYRESLRSV